MRSEKTKVKQTYSLEPRTVETIKDLASATRRSQSAIVDLAVEKYAGDGNGTNPLHPHIAELTGDWLRGLVTAEELAREVAALVLAPPAVSDKQMRLEIPVPRA